MMTRATSAHTDKNSRNRHSCQKQECLVFIERYREALVRDAELFGIELTARQQRLLLVHLWLVLRKNETVNVTALRDPSDALVKHVVDSLLFYPSYAQGVGRFLDMGTGAGYPGIVLAVLKPRPTVLLDSVQKKIAVCKDIVAELGLRNITCVAERAETYGAKQKRCFGVVTARALASLDVLLEYAEPFLNDGGLFITSKGDLSQAESDHGAIAAKLLGFESVSRETFLLPDGYGKRELLVYKKVAPAQIDLPRAVGRAKKRPLWRYKAHV